MTYEETGVAARLRRVVRGEKRPGRQGPVRGHAHRLALYATRSKHGFRFINHSCEPNTFIRCTPKRAEFYALRDIRKGAELTADYGESHHNGRLPCRCGSARCRGFI